MNQEVKEKWVKALRSGEYKQGFRKLRSAEDTFCCLGVLCDLYCKEKGESWMKKSKFEIETYYLEDDHLDDDQVVTGVLPKKVAVWAELKYPANIARECIMLDPVMTISSTSFRKLSAVNDSGLSFLEIAKLIEEQL